MVMVPFQGIDFIKRPVFFTAASNRTIGNFFDVWVILFRFEFQQPARLLQRIVDKPALDLSNLKLKLNTMPFKSKFRIEMNWCNGKKEPRM